MRICVAILLSAITIAGCSSSHTPTAASGLPAARQPRLIGTVLDTVSHPLPGARIQVLDGTSSGATATTDDHGAFELRGTFDETTQLRVSKEGYITSTGTFYAACATCTVSIFLGVDAPPLDLSGAYTLTLAADSSCGELPSAVRRRSYSTTISALPLPNFPADTAFRVSFAGVALLTGHETLTLRTAGDYLEWQFDGGVISEQMAANTYLTFGGKAAASIDRSHASNVSFPLEGGIEYCEVRSSATQCNSAQADRYARCASTNHQLILEKR
jgi:hypothetical protein